MEITNASFHYSKAAFIFFSDVFTQISDTNGFLVKSKFEEYLKEVLALPTAVYEGPSFGFNETAARACFDGVSTLLLMMLFYKKMYSLCGNVAYYRLCCGITSGEYFFG